MLAELSEFHFKEPLSLHCEAFLGMFTYVLKAFVSSSSYTTSQLSICTEGVSAIQLSSEL